jgi:small multidrug resistance pump
MAYPVCCDFVVDVSALAGGTSSRGRLQGAELNYIYLIVAVAFEVVATSALKETNGFTRLWPSVVALAGYACAFYFLSLVLRQVPVGIVYAMWCGAGIVFITAIAWIWFRQTLDLPALLGIGLIMAGVIVINLFSKSIVH